jgi:hypothetical protein
VPLEPKGDLVDKFQVSNVTKNGIDVNMQKLCVQRRCERAKTWTLRTLQKTLMCQNVQQGPHLS